MSITLAWSSDAGAAAGGASEGTARQPVDLMASTGANDPTAMPVAAKAQMAAAAAAKKH